MSSVGVDCSYERGRPTSFLLIVAKRTHLTDPLDSVGSQGCRDVLQ